MEAKRRGFWVALASRPQFIERHFQAGYGDVIDAIFVDEADAITPNWKDPKFWGELRRRYKRQIWLTLSGKTPMGVRVGSQLEERRSRVEAHAHTPGT